MNVQVQVQVVSRDIRSPQVRAKSIKQIRCFLIDSVPSNDSGRLSNRSQVRTLQQETIPCNKSSLGSLDSSHTHHNLS